MVVPEEAPLAVYLFSRTGTTLLATPTGDRLPMEPEQVGGVLALAGGFAEGDGDRVLRVRYDGLGIVGMRGERVVAAVVAPSTQDLDLVPELARFLRRCERRLRRQRSP